MIDIKVFRENPEIIKESEKKRFKDVSVVGKVIELDKKWRESLQEIQKLKQGKNEISKEIGKLRGKDCEELIAKAGEIDSKISEADKGVLLLKEEVDEQRYKIGNIVEDSVPVAETEDGNEIVRTFGEQGKFDFKLKGHSELVEKFAELERASKISGARTYYLKGDLVLLNLGLINLAIKKLIERGFTPMWTPFFIGGKYMKGAAELAE
ncbi:MAG: serine--tRNA ligase, partial [Candidatus Aenigmarchaeota archaeon]|nr:serine--tRNA ligase [Candidatus Aenigmarchaeota archaeon]